MAAPALDPAIGWLLGSEEPVIRYRALRDLLDLGDEDPRVAEAREAIPAGRIVGALLTDTPDRHPYSKWVGAHWRLVSLMDLGVPPDLPGARQQVERVFRWMPGRSDPRHVAVVAGRGRFCASQEGNALAVAVHFGLAEDPRARRLAETLTRWQWPDGGWNCDRRPEVEHASANESLAPLRGLAALARATGDATVRAAADRAAEFFLRHRVAYSEKTGAPMHPRVVRLHYPPYWHHDFFAGLRVLAESGHIGDPRTAQALDLLESKRRPDGTWAPDARHYKSPGSATSLVEVVDWSGHRGAPIEPVTLFALLVLKAAGRVHPVPAVTSA
ncbi:MAG TPA: hypothetical protein VFK38_01560 [Candidatus Limnocylindrales bacterium]|nr:hypothetical protein [Candidatus Limnocylindrales bacterium]